MIVQQECGGGLTLILVSDVGAHHVALGTPNQDAARFRRDGQDFVIAVADGLGSCRNAAQGAAYAVESCINLFGELESGDLSFESGALIQSIINSWRSAVGDASIDDYCTTLKAVFKIGCRVKLISIGDGFSVFVSEHNSILTPYDESSFANETLCLNSRVDVGDFWCDEYALEGNVPYVALCCTDGVANGLKTGCEVKLAAEIDLKTSAGSLARELTGLLDDIAKYCSDDKTVGVVKYE